MSKIKHGRKPTREERKLMQQWKLDCSKWLVVKNTPEQMVLVHRESDKTIKTITKGGEWF